MSTRAEGGRRRTLLTGAVSLAAACLAGRSPAEAMSSSHPMASGSRTVPPFPATPKAAYERLMQGNKRWVTNTLQHPDRDPTRRELLATSQQPYGAVLSCIDSRVSPELVFDTGLGDLFVMRSGGVAVAPVIVGSVAYGPMISGTPLVIVLGHQRCGAISAAYNALREDKPLPGSLQAIAEALRPAYEQSTRQSSADPADSMARTQVELIANLLRDDQDLAPMVSKGTLAVIGAYYSLHTGQIEILSGAPA